MRVSPGAVQRAPVMDIATCLCIESSRLVRSRGLKPKGFLSELIAFLGQNHMSAA